MAEKACHGIREVKKFVDEDGREVLEFLPVYGKNKEVPLVKGSVMVRIGMTAPNGMPMPPQTIRLEWAFPDGTTVKKAFELFDKTAEAEVELWKKLQADRAKENRVVRAGAMPALLGSDGKPISGK